MGRGIQDMKRWVANVKEPDLFPVAMKILKEFKIGKREDGICILEIFLLAKF